MMFRWNKLAAVGAVAALALTGCSSPQASQTTPKTLTLGLVEAAATFEARSMTFANSSPYGQAVYDTLLKADPNSAILPSLATKWEYNAEKTVLTLSLRDDVTFTDGTKFNADAAVQNLLRFRDGTSRDAGLLRSVDSVVAVDAKTVQIRLKQKDPAFLLSLTKAAGLQESPAAFNSPDVKTKPVGSGPYMLDSEKTVAGTSYVFHKNPKYWDAASVNYDDLVLNVYTDPTALLNALKGKQVNAATTLNSADLDQIKASGYEVHSSEVNWLGAIIFDRAGTMNPALKDVRVRQAINYAFDREGMLKALGAGMGSATTQVFPKTSAAYDPALDSRYAYDPAKAKELLAEAGYANGLTLDVPTTSYAAPATFALIKQQLGDVGISVKYTDPGANYITDLLAPKYPVATMGLEQNSDWELINFLIAPQAPWNPAHYSDPKVNELITKVQTGSDAEAAAAAKELNKYIVDQAWFAPWYRAQSSFVTDAQTEVTLQQGNAYPYLWNFKPKM